MDTTAKRKLTKTPYKDSTVRDDLHLHITVKVRQKALREGNTERRRGPSLLMGSTQRLKGFTHRQYTEIKGLHTQAVHRLKGFTHTQAVHRS